MPQIVTVKTTKTSAGNPKNNLALKPKFKKDFENALTIEEARALSLKHVRSLLKK
jgi:hypothetical protein